MAHLHVLQIQPQIYCDLLEGDASHPYYLYIGATEDYPRRFTQKRQGYDAWHAGNNTLPFALCVALHVHFGLLNFAVAIASRQ